MTFEQFNRWLSESRISFTFLGNDFIPNPANPFIQWVSHRPLKPLTEVRHYYYYWWW